MPTIGAGQQTVVLEDGSAPLLWVCALANPEPGKTIRALRFRSAAADLLAVCGVTLFHGAGRILLRYDRLGVYRITLPEAHAEARDRWEVSVDLGVVARQYALPEFDAAQWLGLARRGLGQPGR